MEQQEHQEAPEAENALEGADGSQEAEEQELQSEGEHEELDEPQAQPRDYEKEAEARKYGWKHSSEYTNPMKGWVDADRFLELPSTQNKRLRDEMKSQQSAFEQRMANMERMNNMALERQKAQLESQVSSISQQQVQAVETANTEEYQRLESQKQTLMKQAQEVQAPAQQPQGPDPYVTQYQAENKWTQNPALWQQAIQIVGQNQAVQQMSARDQVQYAESQIKQLYPHFFHDQAPAPKPRQRVDGGGVAPSAGRVSKASKLPPEARKAGEQFVQQGLFKSIEEYAKSYHEG